MDPITLAVLAAAAVIAATGAIVSYIKASSATSSVPALPPPGTVAPCPLAGKPMTLDQAKQYVKDFKNDPNIPFDYPLDCCYARARTMCAQMEKDGYKCQKYWFAGDLAAETDTGLPVIAYTAYDEDGYPIAVTGKPAVGAVPAQVTWGYHVAPLVPVQQSDGSVVEMVLDPSLSDKPLTKKQWQTQCGHPAGKTYEATTDSSAYYPFIRDPATGKVIAVEPDRFKMGDMTPDEATKVLEKHTDNRDETKDILKKTTLP